MTQYDIGNGTTLQQTIRAQGGGLHNQPATSSDDPGPKKAGIADPATREPLEKCESNCKPRSTCRQHTQITTQAHTNTTRRPRDRTTTMFHDLHGREKQQTGQDHGTDTGATRADEPRDTERKQRGCRKVQTSSCHLVTPPDTTGETINRFLQEGNRPIQYHEVLSWRKDHIHRAMNIDLSQNLIDMENTYH